MNKRVLNAEEFKECENFLVNTIKNSYSKFVCFACGGFLTSWNKEAKPIEIEYDHSKFGDYMQVSWQSPLFYGYTYNMHRWFGLKSDIENVGMFRYPNSKGECFAFKALNTSRLPEGSQRKIKYCECIYALSDENLYLENLST